jgi:hypothetical protein
MWITGIIDFFPKKMPVCMPLIPVINVDKVVDN